MCQQTQMPFIFAIFFSDIGHCFRTAQTKSLENQKSSKIRIISNEIQYFHYYARPLHRLGHTTNHDNNRQNSKLTNRQTFPIFVCLVLLYGPFRPSTFLSGSLKTRRNVHSQKSKPKLCQISI